MDPIPTWAGFLFSWNRALSYAHSFISYLTTFDNFLPASLFKSFRVIPSFTPSPTASLEPTSNYNIFFHIWKPESPWNRVNPPPPDFEVVVVKYVAHLVFHQSSEALTSARTMPVPSIEELTALFGSLPIVPYQNKQQTREGKPQAASVGILTRILTWIHRIAHSSINGKGNSVGHLKAGKRSVIFAVVDAGTMSMYRFNEGCFGEWPMI